MESKYLKYQLRLLGLKLAKLKLNIVQSGGSVAQTLESSSNKIDDILHKLRLEHAAISIRMRNTNDIHAENKARIDAQIKNYEEIILNYKSEINKKDELIAINEQYRKDAQEKFQKLLTQLNEFKREKDNMKQLLVEIETAISQIEQGGDQEREKLEKQAKEHQDKIDALEEQVTRLLEEISELSKAHNTIARGIQPNTTPSDVVPQTAALGGQRGGTNADEPPAPPTRTISVSSLLRQINEKILLLESNLDTMDVNNPEINRRYETIQLAIDGINQEISNLDVTREGAIKASENRIRELIEVGEDLIRGAQYQIEETNPERLRTISDGNADIRNTTAPNAVQQVVQEDVQEGVVQQGVQEGVVQQGVAEGVQQDVQEGVQQGVAEGVQQGVQEGVVKQGVQEGVVQQGVPDLVTNPDTLEKLKGNGFSIENIKTKCSIQQINDKVDIDTKIITTTMVPSDVAKFNLCKYKNCQSIKEDTDNVLVTEYDSKEVFMYITINQLDTEVRSPYYTQFTKGINYIQLIKVNETINDNKYYLVADKEYIKCKEDCSEGQLESIKLDTPPTDELFIWEIKEL